MVNRCINLVVVPHSLIVSVAYAYQFYVFGTKMIYEFCAIHVVREGAGRLLDGISHLHFFQFCFV
jgi:hypothetical protein